MANSKDQSDVSVEVRLERKFDLGEGGYLRMNFNVKASESERVSKTLAKGIKALLDVLDTADS